MHLVKRVVPVPLQILEPVPGPQRVLNVPVVCIRYHQTLLRVHLVLRANTKINPIKSVASIAAKANTTTHLDLLMPLIVKVATKDSTLLVLLPLNA